MYGNATSTAAPSWGGVGDDPSVGGNCWRKTTKNNRTRRANNFHSIAGVAEVAKVVQSCSLVHRFDCSRSRTVRMCFRGVQSGCAAQGCEGILSRDRLV